MCASTRANSIAFDPRERALHHATSPAQPSPAQPHLVHFRDRHSRLRPALRDLCFRCGDRSRYRRATGLRQRDRSLVVVQRLLHIESAVSVRQTGIGGRSAAINGHMHSSVYAAIGRATGKSEIACPYVRGGVRPKTASKHSNTLVGWLYSGARRQSYPYESFSNNSTAPRSA